ncbi:MAG: adenylate/guanylate cyclase domain-containing protein [Bacteroidetes bacterium]|nr:MAG: adenylate/guanylate cyclase domain-containing protein [Bacteroidota bacterium]
MSKGNIPLEGDRKKQAAELVKNADKLLKGGDAASAFQAIEQALQLDPGNLYAQAYKERIKTALEKAGVTAPPPPVAPQAPPAPPQVLEPVQKPVEPPPLPQKPVEAEKKKIERPPAEGEQTGKLRKLAAIMFTDMVSYSSLSQTNEGLAIQLIDMQQKLIRPIFKQFDGKEIKTVGDAFLAEFVSVLQAVRCALEIQKTLRDYSEKASKERKIQLRIGVHLGDIIYKDNDIYGDGVNIASRIQALASPGGIYVSQDVYNQIRNRDEFLIEYVGEVELKNILTPIPIYRILTDLEIRQKEEKEAIEIATKEGLQEAQFQKIQEFLGHAKQHLANNAFQEALMEVTKILQINPQHPEARLVDSQIRSKRVELIGKQIEEAKQLPRDQMLMLYKEAVQYALKEGDLTQEELRILGDWRGELNLTENDHEMVLQQIIK